MLHQIVKLQNSVALCFSLKYKPYFRILLEVVTMII